MGPFQGLKVFFSFSGEPQALAFYLSILENGMGGAAAGGHRRPRAAIFVLRPTSNFLKELAIQRTLSEFRNYRVFFSRTQGGKPWAGIRERLRRKSERYFPGKATKFQ
jgi:hypothetical protein